MDGILNSTWPFDRLPVPMFQTDVGGLIRHVNQHWLNLLGLDADAVEGRPLVGFMTARARDQHLRTLQAARGEVCDLESQFLTGAGKMIDVLLSYSFDRDEAGAQAGIVGVAIDLSIRRAAQRAAASNSALLESVVTHANDAILITDAEPIGAPHGPRVLYVNPAFSIMTGYSASDICGKTPRILQGPKTNGQELDRLRSALGTWKPVRVELVNYAKDGAELNVEMDISPVANAKGDFTHWVAIQRNITNRREQEEQRLRTIVEGIPQLMWRSRDNGNWTWTNPQWCSFTGQALEESLGRGWLDAINPEDRAGTIKAWRVGWPNGLIDFDFRVRRASDGAYLWHRNRATPIYDENGRIVEWIGTSTDIQDLKEMQQHQHVLLAELQHRTRNLLAVVQAISGKTLRRSISLQEFATKFDSRLSALSRMQGLLARTNHDMLDLRQLVELELDSHVGLDPVKVQIGGPAIRIGAASARTLALALHELAANAIKYGALGQAAGNLEVDWRVTEDNGSRKLVFDWRESGVAMPLDMDIQNLGFGREILERALPYELNASTHFQFGPDGVRCAISIPLAKAPGRIKRG
ncbi:MAG: domain S-box protein [Rhodospirillales bacterium]|nr:domain S-box protein [Rhodospirillales bacterium]